MLVSSPDIVSEKKARIMEIACQLFREKGYASTSMRDLAQEVGIEAASLYSHVRSKEELLSHICFSLARQFFEARERVQISGGNAAERLQLAIREHVRVVTDNLNASAVFLHDWRFLSADALREFKQLRDNYEAFWLELMQEGKETGLFSIEDAGVSVRNLLSSLNWIYDWYRTDGKYSPEVLAEMISKPFFNGILN